MTALVSYEVVRVKWSVCKAFSIWPTVSAAVSVFIP